MGQPTQPTADPRSVRHRQTARLTLRPITFADAEFSVALFARPELYAHRPSRRPETDDSIRLSVSADLDHWRTHGIGRWAIERDGALIGFGGLTRRDGFDGLNISYHLHPTVWRRGYASEFVAEALAVAFEPLKQTRVFGLVRPSNMASVQVLNKAGFIFERELEFNGAPTCLWASHRASETR